MHEERGVEHDLKSFNRRKATYTLFRCNLHSTTKCSSTMYEGSRQKQQVPAQGGLGEMTDHIELCRCPSFSTYSKDMSPASSRFCRNSSLWEYAPTLGAATAGASSEGPGLGPVCWFVASMFPGAPDSSLGSCCGSCCAGCCLGCMSCICCCSSCCC